MSKPPLQAPRFSTITDADWAREIQAARQRGERDGTEMLRRIRAAVDAQNSRSGKTLENHTGVVAQTRKTCGFQSGTTLVEDANLGKKATDGAGPGAKIGQ